VLLQYTAGGTLIVEVIVKVEIDIVGAVAMLQGANLGDLEADLQAEAENFAYHVGASELETTRKPAPKDAQSEFEIIQFILEVAKEPMAIKAAISSLIYSVNEIASAKSKSNEGDEENKKSVRMKFIGKEIALPASVATIKQFMEEIVKDG